MENLDIVELMISNIPSETEMHSRIKFYMQAHKSNCNNYINSNYSKEVTFLNSLFKSLTCDLSAEIARTLEQKSSKGV